MPDEFNALDDWQRAAIERQSAVNVHPDRDLIATLPPEVQFDLRVRANHALPRSARFQLDQYDQALYESEIALELARLYIDLTRK